MQNYLTPEEVAQHLKVEVKDIVSLVEQGKLRAIRIQGSLRIRETEIDRLEESCAAIAPTDDQVASEDPMPKTLIANSRWCFTRTGRAKFRVQGSVANGANIWPGKMQYPIKFSEQFMDAMLDHFDHEEVAIGGQFDNPIVGSLGEFIQQKLKIKMNPAVYIAALLIEEGYADDSTRRGYIKFRARSARSK